MLLVTGAGGFLGTRLIEALSHDGVKIRGVMRNEPQAALVPCSIETVVADIRDKEKIMAATVGCQTIIHLAGKAHAFDDGDNDHEYDAVNVEGTRNVLMGAIRSGVKRVVFISSVKVFGEDTQGCVDEVYPPNPLTAYGRSKWEAERLVSEYAFKGGLSAVSLRLPMVYGPTKKGNLYRMIAAIDRGWFPPLPRLSTQRSMLHVQNFVQAVQACLASTQWKRPAYIVSDAHPYSSTMIYEEIRRGLGKSVPTWRVPIGVLRIAAVGGDLIQGVTNRLIPFTSKTLEKIAGSACYSPKALMQEVGYKPELSFPQAVPELIEFYRKSLVRCL